MQRDVVGEPRRAIFGDFFERPGSLEEDPLSIKEWGWVAACKLYNQAAPTDIALLQFVLIPYENRSEMDPFPRTGTATTRCTLHFVANEVDVVISLNQISTDIWS